MSLVFSKWPSLGVVALYTEAAGGGDLMDPAAARHAPAYDPEGNLDKIKFSTALDMLEIATEASTTIAHPSVAGSSSPGVSNGSSGSSSAASGNDTTRYAQGAEDYLLVTHGLGYVPDFAVSVDGVAVSAYPVQITGQRARYVTAYATTTEIRLSGVSVVGASGLAAVDITYDVMVFRAPRDASGDVLWSFDPDTGEATAGFGRFSSLRRYLQVMPEGVGSPFVLPYGNSIDVNNGASRQAAPDGSTFEPVPSTQKGRLEATYGSNHISTYTGAWGVSMAYAGSLAAPAGVSVQGPVNTGVDQGKGYSFDPDLGRLSFVNGTDLITSSDGTLVNVLTSSHSFSVTASLADLSKDICYYWSAVVKSAGGGGNQQAQACTCYITAVPQEYSNTTTLMAVPAGADFVIGRIRLNRTTSPASNWMGRALAMLPASNQWMSIFGSFGCLLEADVGLSRSLSVYIDGSNNLVLEKKQSVGAAAGGYATFTTESDGTNYWNEGSFEKDTTAGIPVSYRDSKGSSFASGGSMLTGPTSGAKTFKRTGSSPCAKNDNTNYATAYSVEIEVRFGRRS